jgi:hypothetical protein
MTDAEEMKKKWDSEIEHLKELAGSYEGVWKDVFSEYEEAIDEIWYNVWETDEYDDVWANLYEKDRQVGRLLPQLESQLKAISSNLNIEIVKRKKEEEKLLEAEKAKEKKEREAAKAKDKKEREAAKTKERAEKRAAKAREKAKKQAAKAKENQEDNSEIEVKSEEEKNENADDSDTDVSSEPDDDGHGGLDDESQPSTQLASEEIVRERKTEDELLCHIVKIQQVSAASLYYSQAYSQHYCNSDLPSILTPVTVE